MVTVQVSKQILFDLNLVCLPLQDKIIDEILIFTTLSLLKVWDSLVVENFVLNFLYHDSCSRLFSVIQEVEYRLITTSYMYVVPQKTTR